MRDLLSIYHQLPYPIQVLAASVRGVQLRWWRYSPETERLIAETLERESWDKERWKIWQEEQLAHVLHRAATRVPFYREYWQGQRRRGNRKSWEYLDNWPILEKVNIRNTPEAFVADDCDIRKMFVDHTGGTTGKPTLIYESQCTVREWFAINEARLRRWHGVTYKERWGIFGGQKVVSLAQTRPPYWIHNLALNQLYFSIFHITKETARMYVETLTKFAPTHMVVYPSSLSVLAEHILEQNLRLPVMKVIFSNSEILFNHQKELIGKAFKCPVVDTYGMAELLSGASECASGTMHYWPEIGYLEVLDGETGEILQSGDGSGEFIFTSLLNRDMPLIRYRNGDAGSLPAWDYTCDCKRRLPKFGEVQGRANDLLPTPDGRKLYLLDSLFNGLPLVEAQLVQTTLSEFTVRFVPEKSYQPDVDSKTLTDRLRSYLGDVQVKIQPVDRIPRDGNGKFRPYITYVEA